MRKYVIFMLLFLCGLVMGVEGVHPGSYEVDFELGLDREFVFDFVLDDKVDVSVEGDLAEYVELDVDKVVGRGSVVARLRLPESLNVYGVSNIRIVAGDVSGFIKVRVPYPNRYVDLDLAVPDVNVGEEVLVNLRISNFGEEILNISPVVEIYFADEVLEVFTGEKRVLVGSEEYSFSFDSLNYSAGDYLAVARFDEFIGEEVFRLGEFGLKILDYTREVRGGGIRRFEVEVESSSDERMKEVYCEVRVVEGGGFDSSIVSLGGWEKKSLVGFFDVRGLEGEVVLNIDVFYDGNVESKVVHIFISKRFSWWVWLGGIFVLGLLGFFGWKFFGKSK